jgi:Tfp pilus assembly protein PilX
MAKMYKQARQRGAVLLVGLIILMVAMAAGLTALFSQRMG